MKNFDCVIIGFGTAGSIAAISAARRGASVLVLESDSCAGGMHTAGGIGYYYYQKPAGIAAEIDRKIEAMTSDFFGGLSERKKYVLEETALAAGVEILYQVRPTAALLDGNRITGVEYLCEDGSLERVSAHTVMDCTAEGYFCELAGCLLDGGRDCDRVFQPFTNIMLDYRRGSNVGAANFDAGRIDQYSEPEFSRTMLESSMVHRCDDYRLLNSRLQPSSLPGTREGKHLVPPGGTYTLEDFFNEDEVSDPILFAYTNIDTHANDMPLENDLFLEWMVGCSMWGKNLGFPIPLRTLFSVNRSGVMAPCRCLGVDHSLGHAVRMNGAMCELGENAGIIAAEAARRDIPVEELSYRSFADELILNPKLLQENAEIFELKSDEIQRALASSRPGPGLWASRKKIDAETLYQWMCTAPEGSELRRHSAFALALKRDRRSLPELRLMVDMRDPYTPDYSRKYNHARGYVALCYLGLLADADSVGRIGRILESDFESYKYEYHTHAIGALLRIGENHPHLRPKCADLLRCRAEDPDWNIGARLKLTAGTVKRMDPVFRVAIAGTLKRWGIADRIVEVLGKMPLDAYERYLTERISENA